MNKNELLLEQAKLSTQRFERVIGLLSHMFTLITIVACVWLVFSGIRPLVDGQSADSIKAIAELIKALSLGSIAGYAWGAVATGAWWFERKGKKRKKEKKSSYQKQVEASDPVRTSSGLTETGATPREVQT